MDHVRVVVPAVRARDRGIAQSASPASRPNVCLARFRGMSDPHWVGLQEEIAQRPARTGQRAEAACLRWRHGALILLSLRRFRGSDPGSPRRMADDRWLRVKRLFEAAVEQPESERSAFVSDAVAGDDTLRREVEALLAADGADLPLSNQWLAASESLWAEPPVGPDDLGRGGVSPRLTAGHPFDNDDVVTPIGAGTIGDVDLEPRHPSHVGPYRLLSVLGSGGMGVVYLAEQDQPLRRRVALKRVRPGLDSVSVLRRFDAERQALARMTHPSIARILDAGADEAGRPYFVMELVEGGSITAVLRPATRCRRPRDSSCSRTCARPSSTRTRRASSIATSSRPTSWSSRRTADACRRSSTSALRRRWSTDSRKPHWPPSSGSSSAPPNT